MRSIVVDATGWQDRADGFRAILAALGAPDWHGASLDALQDGLRGEVNGIDAPFRLTLANLPAPLAGFGAALTEIFALAWAEGIDVAIEVTLRPPS